MSWIIFFFGSGLAFYVGVGLQLAGVLAFWRFGGKWAKRCFSLLVVIGLILIILSGTPLPYWLYGAAILCSLACMVGERMETLTKLRRWLRLATFVSWTAAFMLEAPYLFTPHLPSLGQPRLVIIGDSVAAGGGETGVTVWPALLARDHGLHVLDLSRPGATTSSAIRRLSDAALGESDLVLIEIGGNDVLGSTKAIDFAASLDELLSLTCGDKRLVLMFELPVPPFCNDYALAQRRLAAKHSVQLVPKHVLIRVLTADEGTIDSIHLTPTGHERMAKTVWKLIHRAYGE